MMKNCLFIFVVSTVASLPFCANSADLDDSIVTSHHSGLVIFKQVLPDGRILYTDQAKNGSKVERSINLRPAEKGVVWSAIPGSVGVPPTNAKTTVVSPKLLPSIEQAEIEVIRAEMLLEDAKTRKRVALENEKCTSTGGMNAGEKTVKSEISRLDTDVRQAEDVLIDAMKIRNALR